MEWHDLPITEFILSDSGFTLKVTPFNDATQWHDEATISITNALILKLNISGELSPKDLGAMEVNTFDFTMHTNDRLDGKFCILMNGVGGGVIEFQNAEWRFDYSPHKNPSE